MIKMKLLLLTPIALLIGASQTFAWTFSMETSGWQQVCTMDNVVVSCEQFFWAWEDQINGEMREVEDISPANVMNEINDATCTVNGKEIPCDQALNSMKSVFWWFAIVFLIFWIIAIVLTVFWIWMLVDVIKHQHKDKTMWILIVIFLWWLWAIVYYFAARQERVKAHK